MSITDSAGRRLSLAAAALLVVAGAAAIENAQAPAANAACYSGLTSRKAKNVSCKPQARHYATIKNSGNRFGSWAKPGQTSNQSACWANIVSYGMFLPA